MQHCPRTKFSGSYTSVLYICVFVSNPIQCLVVPLERYPVNLLDPSPLDWINFWKASKLLMACTLSGPAIEVFSNDALVIVELWTLQNLERRDITELRVLRKKRDNFCIFISVCSCEIRIKCRSSYLNACLNLVCPRRFLNVMKFSNNLQSLGINLSFPIRY